ncbi:MAG TPA: hypothetical protein VN549_02715 [Negativicutes bacterium]|nr:hypothetical protein [Negativicutes bacterium]
MIILKSPYNGKGGIVEAGTLLALPPAVEKNLVDDGNAEYCKPDAAAKSLDNKKPLHELTKAEMIERAAELGVADIKETMSKAEMITRIEEHGKL